MNWRLKHAAWHSSVTKFPVWWWHFTESGLRILVLSSRDQYVINLVREKKGTRVLPASEPDGQGGGLTRAGLSTCWQATRQSSIIFAVTAWLARTRGRGRRHVRPLAAARINWCSDCLIATVRPGDYDVPTDGWMWWVQGSHAYARSDGCIIVRRARCTAPAVMHGRWVVVSIFVASILWQAIADHITADRSTTLSSSTQYVIPLFFFIWHSWFFSQLKSILFN